MVSVKSWSPDRGDIIWLNPDPQAGPLQTGYKLALVVSPGLYNSKAGLVLLCLITNDRKDYPFEVSLPGGLTTSGVVLADHVKSCDWLARNVVFVERVPEPVIREVLAKLATLVG